MTELQSAIRVSHSGRGVDGSGESIVPGTDIQAPDSAELAAEKSPATRQSEVTSEVSNWYGSRLRRWRPVVLCAVFILPLIIAATRVDLERWRNSGPSPNSDQFQASSEWSGRFRFRPPIEDYEGDVHMVVERRINDHFEGTYSTEQNSYRWRIAGTIHGDIVRWRVTAVVHELRTVSEMLHAHAAGRLDGSQLQMVITIPQQHGDVLADLWFSRVQSDADGTTSNEVSGTASPCSNGQSTHGPRISRQLSSMLR
jgi:hypothetical protein